MAVEVLEEGVDLGEVGKEVAVGSEPALLDDSVAALAGFQNPEFVLLGDAAGGLCELARLWISVSFPFSNALLQPVLSMNLIALSSVPFVVHILTLKAHKVQSFMRYKPTNSTQSFGGVIVYITTAKSPFFGGFPEGKITLCGCRE